MTRELGNIAVDATVQFTFWTYGADGAPIAPSSALENSDVRIYKDGSATQRSSAAGITMTSPFDSLTGCHHLAIDLSDNTDAGFYADGSTYEVVLSPDETVAGLAVGATLARFTIGAANATLEFKVDAVQTAINGYDASINAIFKGLILTDAGGDPIGATGNDATHLHLDGMPWDDDELNGHLLVFFDDDGGTTYVRWITDWVLSTELATLHEALPVTPEAGADTYYILTIRRDSGLTAAETRSALGMASADLDTQLADLDDAVRLILQSASRVGTAQAGGSSTITLDSGASGSDDYYNGAMIMLLEGTGAGSSARVATRRITDYVGSTKVATVDSAWDTNPDSSTRFIIFGVN